MVLTLIEQVGMEKRGQIEDGLMVSTDLFLESLEDLEGFMREVAERSILQNYFYLSDINRRDNEATGILEDLGLEVRRDQLPDSTLDDAVLRLFQRISGWSGEYLELSRGTVLMQMTITDLAE